MVKLNLAGGASGAASGATAGSAFGPWGSAIGGVIGGVAGLFGKKKKKKLSTLDKRQKQLNKQQYAALQGEGPFADLYSYDPEAANEVFSRTIADPAYREFREKLLPEITGAFRSQGLQQSSYAGDALAKTGRDIQESLDAQRAQYLYGEESEARKAKRSAVENLQNRQTFNYQKGAGSESIDNILKSISPEVIESLKKWVSGG